MEHGRFARVPKRRLPRDPDREGRKWIYGNGLRWPGQFERLDRRVEQRSASRHIDWFGQHQALGIRSATRRERRRLDDRPGSFARRQFPGQRIPPARHTISFFLAGCGGKRVSQRGSVGHIIQPDFHDGAEPFFRKRFARPSGGKRRGNQCCPRHVVSDQQRLRDLSGYLEEHYLHGSEQCGLA